MTTLTENETKPQPDTGASKKQLRKAKTQERMLQAAMALFNEGGEEAVSVAATAERAGVTRRTAYAHFGDRAGLVDALHGLLIDRLLENLPKVETEGDVNQIQQAFIGEGNEGAFNRHEELMLGNERLMIALLTRFLTHGVKDNDYYRSVIQQMDVLKESGLVNVSVDSETIATFLIASSWAAQAMTVSSEPDPKKHRAALDKYLGGYRRLLREGLIHTDWKPDK